jgi:3-hydroxyacyl-CoA dehydrogenase
LNALDQDIFAMMTKAVDRAERDGVALVIGNDAPDAFCAGANLFGLMVALGQGNMQGDRPDGGRLPERLPAHALRARPVVAAPFGLALGGGAEVVLGCQVVRAAAELYVGCVEVGVGLIPAGGGCMEMAARASARAATIRNSTCCR